MTPIMSTVKNGPCFYSSVGAHNIFRRNASDVHSHDFGDSRINDALRSRYEIPQGSHELKSL